MRIRILFGMMGWVFTIMICVGAAYSLVNGGSAADELVKGADYAVKLSIELCASYLFWLGMVNVAREAGLIGTLARKMNRPLSRLMPDIGSAAAPVTMNLAANFLGLGNAATPFGIEAMKELAPGCKNGRATKAVCMFLVLNSSAVELMPTSVIAVRTACGSANSLQIVLPTFLSSICAALAAVIAAKAMEKILP